MDLAIRPGALWRTVAVRHRSTQVGHPADESADLSSSISPGRPAIASHGPSFLTCCYWR